MADSTEAAVAVVITPETMPSITWEGARVITTELLARLYGTDEVRLRQNYARNADRFEAGKHFVKLEGDSLRALKQQQGISKILSRARSAILWTERGAARHAKMLETDAAWEVFERLEDCYFTVKEIMERTAYSVNSGDVLTKEEADTLRQMVEGMAKKLTSDTKVQGKFIMQAWSKLKAHFHVSYREIPRQELTEAISIVNRHTVEWELVDEAPALPHQPTVNEIVADWVKKIEETTGYPAVLFMPLVNAVLRKMGFTLPGSGRCDCAAHQQHV